MRSGAAPRSWYRASHRMACRAQKWTAAGIRSPSATTSTPADSEPAAELAAEPGKEQ